MVYPVLQIGKPQNAVVDMEKLLASDMMEVSKYEAERSTALRRVGFVPRREDLQYRRSYTSGISRSWDLNHFSVLHPVMLVLAGEFDLARTAWDQYWEHTKDVRRFSRVVCPFCMICDVLFWFFIFS